ncbi:hypothetical protein [Nonomuraea sp. NPDC049784]|uniref:hypothetical protein n=1 Tax=Nonomuraea sp. NPDC049784 TaxID=3154361 RepID=UPI0033E72C9A
MELEDFSYVLEVSGVFAFLSARPADRDPATAPYNHLPDGLFDDSALARRAARAAAAC